MALQYGTFSQNVRNAYTRDQVAKMQKIGYSVAEIEGNARKFLILRRRPVAPLDGVPFQPTAFNEVPTNNVNIGFNHQMGLVNYGNNGGTMNTTLLPQVDNNDFLVPLPPLGSGLNNPFDLNRVLSTTPSFTPPAPMTYQQPFLAGRQHNSFLSMSLDSQGSTIFGSFGRTNLSGLKWQPSPENVMLQAQYISGCQAFSAVPQAAMTQTTSDQNLIDPIMSQDPITIDPLLLEIDLAPLKAQ